MNADRSLTYALFVAKPTRLRIDFFALALCISLFSLSVYGVDSKPANRAWGEVLGDSAAQVSCATDAITLMEGIQKLRTGDTPDGVKDMIFSSVGLAGSACEHSPFGALLSVGADSRDLIDGAINMDLEKIALGSIRPLSTGMIFAGNYTACPLLSGSGWCLKGGVWVYEHKEGIQEGVFYAANAFANYYENPNAIGEDASTAFHMTNEKLSSATDYAKVAVSHAASVTSEKLSSATNYAFTTISHAAFVTSEKLSSTTDTAIEAASNATSVTSEKLSSATDYAIEAGSYAGSVARKFVRRIWW